MAKWGTKSWEIQKTILHKDGSSVVFNIALEKEGETKKKKKVITQQEAFVFGHPSEY